MTQKILIHGFPHSGTSILKSIIGHCENVEEIINESCNIKSSTDKDFIVCKYPHTLDSFFTSKYDDYIKIFIVRDPRYVFSSLNKRLNYNLTNYHSIQQYIKTIKNFSKYIITPRKDIYCLKYEDMFDDNFKVLRDIFDSIGFQYTDKIFDNSQYENSIHKGTKIPDAKPENKDHLRYRMYQINQPFQNMNDPNKLDLTKEQLDELEHNEFINIQYPILLSKN
tara:strand:- start:1009 stop:1677 length:669 start_codon:yes stop_codon:yes gene_type:complete